MENLLDYICYHEKWHGNIQNWRKKNVDFEMLSKRNPKSQNLDKEA